MNISTQNHKKILLVITRLDAGGSADLTLRLAAGLTQHGHRVLLLSGPSPAAAQDLFQYAQRHNFGLRILKPLRRELHPFFDLWALASIWREILAFRPQVLHTNTSKAGFLGRLAGHLAHVPRIVHSDHGHIFYGYYTPALTFFFVLLEKIASHWCHKVLTLTETGRRDYLRLKIGKPQQYAVSSGGTDLSPFFAHPNRPVFMPDESHLLRIIWVGRMVPIKNLPLLLRAITILEQENFPAEYWIVGDGPERESSEHTVRTAGLRQVKFWGFRQDIPQLLARCDLFVFTSLNEGFGLVIIEAMACGLPIVGPAVGGTPDLINENNGILIPSDDAPALAAAIRHLAFLPDLRRHMSQCNQKKAANYTIDNYISRVMGHYFTLEKRNATESI